MSVVVSVPTVAFQGIEACSVEVQVHISESPQAAFVVVGLPDKAVGESRERVRSAISAIGLSFPFGRVVVNLAPADVQKEGSHYDLAITLGILISMDILPREVAARYLMLGELSLDGRILRASGILPAAMHAVALGKGLICPEANGEEARWSGITDLLAPPHILALINHFNSAIPLPAPPPLSTQNPPTYPDMADIKGQPIARRALEVAACGGHNLLMVGPPGSGKSMLAARLPGLLPPMDSQELLENSVVSSVAGLLAHGTMSATRPFREPHHSCSMAALVGGGKHAKPGEITLAHNGVLFLDELPEMQRGVLDALRQPLETGKITVARAEAHVTYPAKFQLVAAMNPCRCGYLGDPRRACTRVPICGRDYQSKLSGPLLDRIDLFLHVPTMSPREFDSAPPSESTETVRARVLATRRLQAKRYHDYPSVRTNAEATPGLVESAFGLTAEAKAVLMSAMEQWQLSMRSYHRIIRVARTLADMVESADISVMHMSEAISYRRGFVGG